MYTDEVCGSLICFLLIAIPLWFGWNDGPSLRPNKKIKKEVKLLEKQIKRSMKRGDSEIQLEILNDQLEVKEMEMFYSTEYGRLYPKEFRQASIKSLKTNQRIRPCEICGRLVKSGDMFTHQESDEICKSEAERQAKEQAEKWEQEEADRARANEKYMAEVRAQTITDKEIEKRSRRISAEVKSAVFERDDGKCVKCGSSENIEFDHDIPFSKGGSNEVGNIQILCVKCNRQKSNKIM